MLQRKSYQNHGLGSQALESLVEMFVARLERYKVKQMKSGRSSALAGTISLGLI